MAWLANQNFQATDRLRHTDLNNLTHDDRIWGGNVDGGGYTLGNVVLAGTLAPLTGPINAQGQPISNVGLLSAASIEVGVGAGISGNRFSIIDLVGDDTYTDYGMRLVRENTGPNAKSGIFHRGSGELRLQTIDAAPITFLTSATECMRVVGGGVGIGTSNPRGGTNLDVPGVCHFGRVNFQPASGDCFVDFNDNPATSTTQFRQSSVLVQFGNNALPIEFLACSNNPGNSYQLYLGSNGNVGLGHNSPQTKLYVLGTAAPPDLGAGGATAGMASFYTGTGVGVAIGVHAAGSYPVWIQSRFLTSNGTVYPLALNPIGGRVIIGALELGSGASKLVLAGIPTSASGLTTGDVWCDVAAGRVLKLV